MQRLPVFLFSFLLALFLAATAFAGGKIHAPAKIHTDAAKVYVKKFDAHAIEKYKADKDFNYNGPGAGYQESFWDRFWGWIWDKISRLFSSVPNGSRFLLYGLLITGVVFLVYFILKSAGIDPIKLWRGDSERIEVPYTESLENIHGINFDAEIEKAISQYNYRLAVRLLYLKCLKQLSDSKLINWQIDKTNSVYLYELTDAAQKQTFGLLTRQFEYVWYGNFSIDKQAFGDIYTLFQDFKKQMP